MEEDYGYLDTAELQDMATFLAKEELSLTARIKLLQAEILVRDIDKDSLYETLENIQNELKSVRNALKNKKENA